MELNFSNVSHNENHFTLDSHGGTSHVQHPITTIVHEDPFRGSVGKGFDGRLACEFDDSFNERIEKLYADRMSYC